MLRRERLSSAIVFNYYSPELPSPRYFWWDFSHRKLRGFFYPVPFARCEAGDSISPGGRSPAVRYRQHEDGGYWLSWSARPEPTPSRSMLWASWPGTRTTDRGMLRDPINDTVAPSHISRRGGHPAPSLPPPSTKSHITLKGSYEMTENKLSSTKHKSPIYGRDVVWKAPQKKEDPELKVKSYMPAESAEILIIMCDMIETGEIEWDHSNNQAELLVDARYGLEIGISNLRKLCSKRGWKLPLS